MRLDPSPRVGAKARIAGGELGDQKPPAPRPVTAWSPVGRCLKWPGFPTKTARWKRTRIGTQGPPIRKQVIRYGNPDTKIFVVQGECQAAASRKNQLLGAVGEKKQADGPRTQNG